MYRYDVATTVKVRCNLYNPKVDYLPLTSQPVECYYSYAAATCQRPQVFILIQL